MADGNLYGLVNPSKDVGVLLLVFLLFVSWYLKDVLLRSLY